MPIDIINDLDMGTGLSVSMGKKPGYSIIDKFGENPVIDTGTAPEDIWEQGGEYTYDAPGTAPIQYVSSSDALDTGNIVSILGLDIDGNEVSQTITTTGQTNVVLSTPLWRVYRMVNEGDDGTSLIGMLYCHTDVAPTDGVPLTANIRAIINNGNNQSLMALYTVPLGKVGYLYRGELGVSRSQTTGEARTAYFSRRVGKLFTVKKRINLTNQGSSIYQDSRSFPDIIPALTDIKLSVESVSANGMGIWGAFDILLVNESELSDGFLQAIKQPTVMPN